MSQEHKPLETNGRANIIICVNERELVFRESLVNRSQILEKANLLPVDCHDLYLEVKGQDLRKVTQDEQVDISKYDNRQFVTKEPDSYPFLIDNQYFTTNKRSLTPLAILELANIDTQIFYLVQELSDGQEIIYAFTPEEQIRLRCPALKFITRRWEALVDVEEFGKQCKPVPPARQYKIRIDKSYYIIESPSISGKEVCQLGKKIPPEKFDIFAFFSNKPKPEKVGLEEPFYVTFMCFTRFVIQPKEQQDGRGTRREFSLPEEDTAYLNGINLTWETVRKGGLWLIIYNYSLPAGYLTATAELALMIPPNYPATEIDMVYFHPDLRKLAGSPIRATTPQIIDDRPFQRWSRHRTPGQWRPGIDDISTHLLLVDKWLINELSR
jgi:hypothetical protein